MEGVLERAWNHPPLDKCLELVEDSTERSTRGVTERWARGFLLFRLTECTTREICTVAPAARPKRLKISFNASLRASLCVFYYSL